MKMEKGQINELLLRWIKWDAKLQGQLREVQIKLLIDRIVLEKTYDDLANEYQVSPKKIRQILLAVIVRIEKIHSRHIGQLLQSINTRLESGAKGRDPEYYQVRFGQVFLN